MNTPEIIEADKKTPFAGGHALVVAVANYAQAPVLPLSVLNDAQDVVATLNSAAHCGYASENVKLLLDSEATLDAMRQELDALAARAQPRDTVLIFFSGHGARLGDESALVPVDCDAHHLAQTTLPEQEFSAALARIKAERLVVLIDACHAGAVASFKSIGATLNLGFNEKSLKQLAQGTGRVLIASSRATEYSYALSGARNSLFTEHLLGALRGGAHTHGDGLIRVFEVFNYVSERVRQSMPDRQHPIFKASDLEDNFPIALELGGVKRLDATSAVPQSGKVWRQLEEILSDLYPAGPQDQEIWLRAGGDISRLRLGATGRSSWFAALRTLRQGGGGDEINQNSLIDTALQDFPHHQELKNLGNGI
ncbi:caspase family protein [Pseudomonas syringae]|uniref:caspase family protein n=1 Tax=Pseudomonas syringae TaxID=317 RepID=UPI000420D057|nr:caspase family protein [Pseudomonas syringae]UOF20797.1 caspase family protein [Pseudomonas syringae CC440]UZA78365.1 caspase family protein [Pseudomonas syringae]